MDSVGLIHMNGRVYDPRLGRFISADPFVQAPHNTQSLNRYSYVVNNPVRLTDPSGYYYGVENLLYATIIRSVTNTIVDIIRYHGVQSNGLFNPATLVAAGSVPGAFGNGTFGFPDNRDFCSQTTVMCIQPSTLPGAGPEVRRTVGKTISEGTGGKFANGAAYGAFSVAVEGVARSYVDNSTNEPEGEDGSPTPSSEKTNSQEIANPDRTWTNPTGEVIRGCDSQGCGYYDAPRRYGLHQGADYTANPGQDVVAVTDGVVDRVGYPYGDDLRYRYVRISTSDGYVIRQLYVSPAEKIQQGTTVVAGQVIATYQGLGTRYPGITEHVHVDIRHGGIQQNPTKLIPP